MDNKISIDKYNFLLHRLEQKDLYINLIIKCLTNKTLIKDNIKKFGTKDRYKERIIHLLYEALEY